MQFNNDLQFLFNQQNGDYDGNQPAGHSAVNKEEDNLLLLHQQKLTKVPSDGKNAPSDKEAYRTNLKAAEGGLQIKNIGKIADDAEMKKGLNVVNRETDSRHAHIFHSTFNSSNPSRDKSNGKLGRLEEWERPPTPPATYYPKCSITRADVEPYSAISRATTSECKQDIADIVCKMKQGTLYPMKMPRFCPVEAYFVTGLYLQKCLLQPFLFDRSVMFVQHLILFKVTKQLEVKLKTVCWRNEVCELEYMAREVVTGTQAVQDDEHRR
ncbi:Xylosyltransferase [Apostichopus japonicus]|uniref:Xylosyltransferase n=1 Tax=Stichopus japonicus TaxID=307972 RepID=A0A2G8LHF2_STIJA|nr:Xylosyltransferase [Apostichopus japonicus]